MSDLYLALPHQLFEEPPIPEGVREVILLEEPLFFTQFSFHRTKIIYHRATMNRYAEHLESRGYTVRYVEAEELQGEHALESVLRSALGPGPAARAGTFHFLD